MTTKDNLTVIEEENEALRESGRQLKMLLPGGDNLSDNQAISLAKYAQVTKANPFRGEVYGYPDSKGNMQLVDGYKILVRWAKKVSNYSDKYELLAEGDEGTIKGDVAYRCWIMRHDLKNELTFYIQSGASFQEAYELVATSAVGLVTAGERKNAAPKGWTWDQQARKRALKNCLNLAYAMPSIDELAADSWQVDGTQTKPEDWQEVEIYKSEGERERHAQLAAWNRQAEEDWDQAPPDERKAKVEASRNLMRDNGDDDPLALKDDPVEAEVSNGDAMTQFWTYQRGKGIDIQIAKDILSQASGDFEEGKTLLEKYVENFEKEQQA